MLCTVRRLVERLDIDECLDGVRHLVESDFTGPVNIGLEEMVTTINWPRWSSMLPASTSASYTSPGPLGVRGRNSDNRLIGERQGWSPSKPLRDDLKLTHGWIEGQVRAASEMVTA